MVPRVRWVLMDRMAVMESVENQDLQVQLVHQVHQVPVVNVENQDPVVLQVHQVVCNLLEQIWAPLYLKVSL